MKSKWLYLVLFSGILSIGACTAFKDKNSQQGSRNPAGTYDIASLVANDPFNKDGYDHSSSKTRNFGGGKISDEELIRELAGREIWFKSAPNERFHTYYFPQKLGSPIAWYKVLRADRFQQRFDSWGLINDPDCCVPGVNCSKKGPEFLYNGKEPTREDTFGFEYCRGDDVMLDILHGKRSHSEWEDPAVKNPILQAADALDKNPREHRKELAFGQPAGAVGYRKFPNPRFNLAKWQAYGNKQLLDAKRRGQQALEVTANEAGWQEYETRMSETDIDASIEPPFRIGKSCASCHAAFDPLNPPTNYAQPEWSNIKGETGNQYLNAAAILGSGTRPNQIEHQMFLHTRAGAADTSAVGHDFINNPGTINAIINIPQRPTFVDNMIRWDDIQGEGAVGGKYKSIDKQNVKYTDSDGKTFSKTWYLEQKDFNTFHILKGGEDSVGADLAVQRVYINVGMCAEQCWVNHLVNMREFDKTARGFGQTPFDIGQCRQDCASWRANEDRVGDVLTYLLSRRPTDLKDALPQTKNILVADVKNKKFIEFVEKRYGASVEQGKQIFTQRCSECHSSQNTDRSDLTQRSSLSDAVDYFKTVTLPSGEIVRSDWLGNDKSTSVKELGTYMCRSIHTNHSKGHVYEEFGSETLRNRRAVGLTNSKGQALTDGRGYYRNISLLNAWAHAPFLHNNAVGPEICGNEKVIGEDKQFNLWKPTARASSPSRVGRCESSFDPSVNGRIALFEKSFDELLTPTSRRDKKVAYTDVDISFPLGFKLEVNDEKTGLLKSAPLALIIPKGTPVSYITSLDMKSLGADFIDFVPLYKEYKLAMLSSKVSDTVKAIKGQNTGGTNRIIEARKKINSYWKEKVGENLAATMARNVITSFDNLISNPKGVFTSIAAGTNERLKFYAQVYSNCLPEGGNFMENGGHDFGTDLSDADKQALKAFLITL